MVQKKTKKKTKRINKFLFFILFVVSVGLLGYYFSMKNIVKTERKIVVHTTKDTLSEAIELADSIKAPTTVRYTAAILFYKYSKECVNKEITPELLYAIALTESNFNPKAKSKADALGLMQIKYSTAKWLKDTYKLSMPVLNLYDLEENIYYSVKYLDFLCTHFKNKGVDKNLLLVYVIIAYNEGQNAPVLKKGLARLMQHKYLKKVYVNSMKGRN